MPSALAALRIPYPELRPYSCYWCFDTDAAVHGGYRYYIKNGGNSVLKKKAKLRKGTEVQDGGSGLQFIVREVGMCLPETFPTPELLPGQIGYLEAKVPSNTFLTGQTLTENPVGKDIESYGNFKLMKPSVFASFYPQTDKPFSTFRKIWMTNW